jgi:adenosine deaminase
MGRRNSDLQVEKRIDDILTQITKGVICTKDLLKFIKSKYDLSEAQGRIDIAKAKEQLRGLFTDWEREEQKNLSIQRYNLLFNRNFTIQDYREARNVQQAIDKILGNEAPIKTETNLKTDIPAFKWAEDGD